ncbi:amine oxidase [Baffinella frigidus]|nr:amine oxidase [Cryptophyta sp. CCMP2293]
MPGAASPLGFGGGGEVYQGLVDWHAANLEFSMGTPLRQVCNRWWNFDDAHAYPGHHWLLPEGLGALATTLLRGETRIDVRLSHQVTRLERLAEDRVMVHARSLPREDGTGGGGDVVLEADAVVVTLPLGVLKEGKMEFDPPLSEAKSASISRMGFGLLNKVVLEFDHAFWTAEQGRDFFGLGLLAGDSAYESEARSVVEVIERAQAHNLTALVIQRGRAALATVFSDVPPHVRAHVTRWGAEEFSRGSYSFIRAGAGGGPKDHEEMGRPEGRVFFAGEHTSVTHPSSVQGALLTGIRAAGLVLHELCTK